jgi:small-conductance mechanosensitive channel
VQKPGAIRAFSYGEAGVTRETRKVEWRRLLLLIPRLLALVLLWRFLMDWPAASIPAYAGLAHDVVGIVLLYLLVVFVMAPMLEACGERIDRSTEHEVTSFRWICGFALLAAVAIALNRLRYYLEIDADPLYNRLWNVLIVLAGAAVYGLIRYVDRRRIRSR